MAKVEMRGLERERLFADLSLAISSIEATPNPQAGGRPVIRRHA